MRPPRPPALATWSLEHFCFGTNDEYLIGDLMEEYWHGRSRAWYWKQVLGAIATASWKDIRDHKLLGMRALIVGWTVLYGERWLWRTVEFFGCLLRPWLRELFFSQALVSWTIKFPVVPGLVIESLMFAVSGWAIARFHRSHKMAMALLFTASVEIWNIPWFLWICRLLIDSIGDPRYRFSLICNLLLFFLIPACTIAGAVHCACFKSEPLFEKHLQAI